MIKGVHLKSINILSLKIPAFFLFNYYSVFRDTYASLMGHYDLTNYLAIGENESKARIKFNLLEKMLQPCGPPPEKKTED